LDDLAIEECDSVLHFEFVAELAEVEGSIEDDAIDVVDLDSGLFGSNEVGVGDSARLVDHEVGAILVSTSLGALFVDSPECSIDVGVARATVLLGPPFVAISLHTFFVAILIFAKAGSIGV